MRNAHAPVPIAKIPTTETPIAETTATRVEDVLRRFTEHQRLIKLVKTMTDEIERLREDNRQLHAAVKMYREVVRRRLARAG